MELISPKLRKEFKILYMSNAPFSPSGYGVQCNGNCYDWLKAGYNVRVLANFGVQGRMLGLNGLMIYPPLLGDPHGDKTSQLIFTHWKPDLYITLYDIWMGAYTRQAPNGQLIPIHPFWVPIIMVDHEPIPESTLEQAKVAYKIVAPTLYGQREFTKHGVDCLHIPFGIDTKTFKPTEDKSKDKVWLNKRSIVFNRQDKTEIDEDSFLIVTNGANKDPYRKAFTRMFIAIQLFLQNNPDAQKDLRVYVHSWMRMARDIPHGASVLNVDKFCRGAADYHMLCGVPDEGMARIYNAADVYFHLSQAGGFELPVLESMSCGVPPICSDFINMHELAEGCGWLVPCKTKFFTPLDSTACIADEYKAAEALEEAYNNPDKIKKLGEKSRERALQFDWSLINPIWHRLFDSIIEERRYKPLEMRKI